MLFRLFFNLLTIAFAFVGVVAVVTYVVGVISGAGFFQQCESWFPWLDTISVNDLAVLIKI